jgi:protein-S-isoprenylcysteine O-methyltransferase Ste14
MFEPILASAFLALFLIVLVGGGAAMRRRKIDMEGLPPIGKNLFHLSKLVMAIPWTAMILQAFGLNLSPVRVPLPLRWISLGLWVFGFGLMLAGRIGLGSSFRIGCPKDEISLRTDGIFRYSRNPIYLGIYITVLAASLYTLNPLVLIAGAGVAVVHHRIVLAEEECLRKMFGQAYEEYCRRVGRYF